MPAIQRAHPDGEREIELLHSCFKLEIFDRDLTVSTTPIVYVTERILHRQADRLFRSVDRQYISIADPIGDSPGRTTRSATDLQHPHALAQWQRIHDRFQAWR